MQIFKDNVRIGMVFPDGVENSHEVLFPSYDHQEPAYAATIAAEVNAANTLIEPAVLAGNLTLNLTPNANLKGGEKLVVKILSDANVRTVTLGTSITGPALTTVASKTHVGNFLYDGTDFIQTAPWVQID